MKTTASLVLLISCAMLQAADWPAWRGPTGQGFCEEKNVLLKWSTTSNGNAIELDGITAYVAITRI